MRIWEESECEETKCEEADTGRSAGTDLEEAVRRNAKARRTFLGNADSSNPYLNVQGDEDWQKVFAEKATQTENETPKFNTKTKQGGGRPKAKAGGPRVSSAIDTHTSGR